MAVVAPVWVTLVVGDVKHDACSVHGVDLDGTVELAKGAVFSKLSLVLNDIHPVQVKLFLSSKAGVKASPPERIGDALAPDETLLSEVLGRLNPTGAGAGASFPDPLYLLAVAEGACCAGGR